MKKIIKRLLTGVLTLATVFTALPVTQVHAANSVYTHSDGKTGTVIKVTDGGEVESTFQEGWMKADGETAYCIQLGVGVYKNFTATQYAMGTSMEQSVITQGVLSMNLNDYSVKKNGKEIELTAKEFEILKLLLQNPKKVYTKEQIYSLVWNDAYLGDENAVNVHISRLRTKIEDNPRDPQYIITVWGIGYKLGDFKE